MLQVSIGSNYSDDDSTHESGSREGRGRGEEIERASGPRGEREGKKEEVATKESEERERAKATL